jgi:hypothetical protein
MIVKAKLRRHLKKLDRSKDRPKTPMSAEDTSARVKAVLAKLAGKDSFTILAYVPSESATDRDYEIRMGSNHSVFCTCKGWQYSKTGTCKHLERFKAEFKPDHLPRR